MEQPRNQSYSAAASMTENQGSRFHSAPAQPSDRQVDTGHEGIGIQHALINDMYTLATLGIMTFTTLEKILNTNYVLY